MRVFMDAIHNMYALTHLWPLAQVRVNLLCFYCAASCEATTMAQQNGMNVNGQDNVNGRDDSMNAAHNRHVLLQVQHSSSL